MFQFGVGRCLYRVIRNNYSGVRSFKRASGRKAVSWIFLPRNERVNVCPMARPSAPVNHYMILEFGGTNTLVSNPMLFASSEAVMPSLTQPDPAYWN